MDEHTVIEHLGNLGVILLTVLLSTSLHFFFKALKPWRPAGAEVSSDQAKLLCDGLTRRPFH